MSEPHPATAAATAEHASNTTPLQQAGATLGQAAASAVIGGRAAIRDNKTANSVYRTGVGVVGGATVALGVVLMPLPGPGALISLGGLGILSTEFQAAKKVRAKATAGATRAFAASKAVAKRAAEKRRASKAAASTDASS